MVFVNSMSDLFHKDFREPTWPRSSIPWSGLTGTGAQVEGSPARALKIAPKFDHFYFIDMNKDKIAYLQKLCEGRADVDIHAGDTNAYLRNLLPTIRYEKQTANAMKPSSPSRADASSAASAQVSSRGLGLQADEGGNATEVREVRDARRQKPPHMGAGDRHKK
jgi:hypothetical protein